MVDKSPLDNRTFQWIVGVVLTVLLAIGGFILHTFEQRLLYLENNGPPPMRERLARLENETTNLARDIHEIKLTQREILQLIKEVHFNDLQEGRRQRLGQTR